MSPRVMHRLSRLRLILAAVAATLLGVGLAGAPAAHADSLGLGGIGCGTQTLEHPFLPWADPNSYVLAPGGTFESGAASWSLTGSATVTTGNEPWHVHGAGSSSLLLPAGSSAASPFLCTSLQHPTLRFFARSIGGSILDHLHVDVLFQSTVGLSSLPVGDVSLWPAWSPTLPFIYAVNSLAPLGSGYQTVAFRFTPVGSASWRIDDVYVDPYAKG